MVLDAKIPSCLRANQAEKNPVENGEKNGKLGDLTVRRQHFQQQWQPASLEIGAAAFIILPYICALMEKHHPNSWLPSSGEHIIRLASPFFKVIHHSSGRLDYIETNRRCPAS